MRLSTSTRRRLVLITGFIVLVTLSTSCSDSEENSDDPKPKDTDVWNRSDVADASAAEDTKADSSDAGSVDMQQNDASDSATDSSGGIADLVVSDHRLEPIPPRELGNFHIEMIATVRNKGPAAATGMTCFYKIVPLEMRGRIETLQGEVPLNRTSLEADAEREVSVELDRDAESGDEDYNARFEIRCSTENEQSRTEDDNSASIDSTVLYY